MNRARISICLAVVCVIDVVNFASAETIRGINIDFVTIGNAGNAGDTRTQTNIYGQPYANPYGCGAVSYEYRIGKYEVTNSQWNAYAVATGTPSNYPVYSDEMQPVNSISWYDAAQFCNYLTSGNKNLGAYQLGTDGSITINRAEATSAYGTIYVIPTEDEWYKAAYCKPNGSGYSLYSNGTNTLPLADNGWNYYGGSYDSPWNVGTGNQEQNGTFDIMGNVAEWNESFIYRYDSPAYGMRGGSFSYYGGYNVYLASSSPSYYYPQGSMDSTIGFRVASIPEPCTLLLLMAGSFLIKKR